LIIGFICTGWLIVKLILFESCGEQAILLESFRFCSEMGLMAFHLKKSIFFFDKYLKKSMHSQKGNKNALLYLKKIIFIPLLTVHALYVLLERKKKIHLIFFFPLLVTLRNLEVK
jgi:hypothetical protein